MAADREEIVISTELTDAIPDELAQQWEALIYENNKLKKINGVLMRRVEMGWGNHSDAYESFQSAALLADKVKSRTLELNQLLNQLTETNRQLNKTKQESEIAQQRLIDAIESSAEGFVLFDRDKRMVLANSRFMEFWNTTDVTVEPGKTTLPEMIDKLVKAGLFNPKAPSHKKPKIRTSQSMNGVFRLNDGRWIQMTQRSTKDAGWVIRYSDITDAKGDPRISETATVEEEHNWTQLTLDNMSVGIAMVDAGGCVKTWNQRFLELTCIPMTQGLRGANFEKLIQQAKLNPILGQAPPPRTLESAIYDEHQFLINKREILIRRKLLNDGSFISSYTDITERSRNEGALLESEKRIRLITDAFPAIIYYVNKNLCYDFANRAFEEWHGCRRSDVIDKSMQQLLGNQEFAKHEQYIKQALNGQSVNFEIQITRGESENLSYFRKNFVPHFDENGSVIGFFALEQDISQQRRTSEALRQSYEHMEKRVFERTRELTKINELLKKENLERKLAEAKLIQAKRAADEANESKTKFLAATSHDLLQPVNAARLFASALSEKKLPENITRLVNSLNHSLDDVESLIGALVDISKLDAGVVKSSPEIFQANDLLSILAQEFDPQARLRQIDFHYVPCRLSVNTDSQLLARILRNFLSNAIRYTEKGRILLGCRRRGNHLEIQVIDTGVGIPNDKVREIFKEFMRLDGDGQNHDKGLGLGLAIVDKISGVLNHQVLVSSEYGRGSSFSILVPVVSPDQASQVIPKVNLQKFEPGHNARILVIENDQSICEGMCNLLGGWGYEVLSANDPAEFEENSALLEPSPDLIVADYHLDHGQTGVDAIHQVNSIIGHELPVIMITANYSIELRNQMRESGYTLLNKPVKPIKLRSALNHLLS